MRHLTPARTADLLAVALNISGFERRSRGNSEVFRAYLNVSFLFRQPAAAQLSAAEVEALLQLVMQGRARNAKHSMSNSPIQFVGWLCKLPAAAQLPTAAVVELAQQAVQYSGPGPIRVHSAMPFFQLLAGRQLTAEHVESLLSLRSVNRSSSSSGFPAGDACAGQAHRVGVACQPAAVFGISAADACDPVAAALLLVVLQAASAARGAVACVLVPL